MLASTILLLISISVCSSLVIKPEVQFYERGLTASIPNVEGMEEVTFTGGLKRGQKFSETSYKPNGKKWTVSLNKVKLKDGDEIFLWVDYKLNGEMFVSDVLQLIYDHGEIVENFGKKKRNKRSFFKRHRHHYHHHGCLHEPSPCDSLDSDDCQHRHQILHHQHHHRINDFDNTRGRDEFFGFTQRPTFEQPNLSKNDPNVKGVPFIGKKDRNHEISDHNDERKNAITEINDSIVGSTDPTNERDESRNENNNLFSNTLPELTTSGTRDVEIISAVNINPEVEEGINNIFTSQTRSSTESLIDIRFNERKI